LYQVYTFYATRGAMKKMAHFWFLIITFSTKATYSSCGTGARAASDPDTRIFLLSTNSFQSLTTEESVFLLLSASKFQVISSTQEGYKRWRWSCGI
jgi:hypothetical protein